MCGICGLYNYNNSTSSNRELIRAMTSIIAHRGPDDDGIYIKDGTFAIGMRRLSIIDLETGQQPIHNENRTIWVMLNGEIYNFPDLRRELFAKGHVFYTNSDTEIIAHAYEEWGDDSLLRFNGIFGLSIWDEKNHRLVLARDPYGVKPLYYYDDGSRFVWGSEIKAILADPKVPRLVDVQALDLFLTFRFVPSPFTLFKGIRKILPGHRVIVEAGKWREERYYFSLPKKESPKKEEDYIGLLQEGLEAAVRRQMISDVPIGLLLSGGIDSAAVLAVMNEQTREPVRTFTVGFKDVHDINELEDARHTAHYFGAEHQEILMDSIDYRDWLRKCIWHLEEPIGTTSALPMYFVSQLAREHVKVVLTGQGADEPLCGYHRYYGERYGHLYRKIPDILLEHFFRPLGESLPRQERIKRAVRSMGIRDVTERFLRVYEVFHPEMKKHLWRPDGHPELSNRLAESIVNFWRNGIDELDPLVQMAYVDTHLSLSDDLLLYGDKMSMAHSVEARVPFLDLEYMKIVESLPPSLRIRGLNRKYIHKKSIEKWLPRYIIRRKKRGFETPVDQWFRSELTGFVKDTLLSKNSACTAYFYHKTIKNLIKDHINGRQDNRRQLFCLLIFDVWHKTFIQNQSLQS